MPPKPDPSEAWRSRKPDAIVQRLSEQGVDVPAGCYQVTVNNEERPTYITFDCRVRRLIESDDEAARIARAIQVHKVGHKLSTSK
jgi:hypothetical protein